MIGWDSWTVDLPAQLSKTRLEKFDDIFLRTEWIFLVRSKSPRSFSYWSCGQKYEKVILESFGGGFLWYKAADSDFFIGISLREVWKSTSEELQIRIPHFLPQLQYVLWVRFSPICDPMLHLGGRSHESFLSGWNSLYWSVVDSWKLTKDDSQMHLEGFEGN